MKSILKEFLLGFLIYASEGVLTMVMTSAHVRAFEDQVGAEMPYEFIIMFTIIAVLVTGLVTWRYKPKTKAQAFRMAIIWTASAVVLTPVIFNGIETFRFPGVYFMLFGIFIVPVIYAKIKHLS